MSSPELPENLKDWPSDPFALLGVARDTEEIEIKRAYTRLIRRFKPEHFPDQFRRIREAYEACLAQFQRFFTARDISPFERPELRVQPSPAPRPAPPDEPQTSSEPDLHIQPPATREAPALHSAPLGDEIARLWAAAIEGRTEDAYTGLVGQASMRPDRADIALRLYWLLGLQPALDATRTRHDWLAAALKQSRLSGPAAELYRRELDADPVAALYGPYAGMLSTEGEARELLTIARWRLNAAGRSRSFGPPSADIAVLAAVLPFHDEPGWLGYLAVAIDWTAWERSNAVFTKAREELDRLRHLELSHSFFFDRIEEAERASAGWSMVRDQFGSPSLIDLVPQAWADPGGLSWHSVIPCVDAVGRDARRGLITLDRAALMHGWSINVVLVRGLDAFYHRTRNAHGEYPPELIRGLTRSLRINWRDDYDRLRVELLEFLIAEAIHPFEFSEACEVDPDDGIRESVSLFRRDATLWLVWLAAMLHRGPA